jgi:hypothetical protein
MLLKLLRVPFALTALGLIVALWLGGFGTLFVVAILAVLEVSLSFDNAVVNAKILARLNHFWQEMFLTVGVFIAVFGMRLVFPLAILCIAAGIGPSEALALAISRPDLYEQTMRTAHPAIAAFGGTFLLMIFLDWIFEEREVNWLGPIERFLAAAGKLDYISVSVAVAVLLLTVSTFAKPYALTVAVAGLAGLLSYMVVGSLDAFFEDEGASRVARRGLAAFSTFLYLEVLDASFSFDGVLGALAISNKILVIALGLGIGALYIRTLTVYLTRKGTLREFRYLEHGAMYAIGALAVMLFIGISHELPEVVTGLVGVGFILTAFGHSWLALKGEQK